ncbi:MAG: DUF4365 domain-containing protein [Sumerlaeia bacterium]
MPRSPRRPKTLPESSITGQKGINVIEGIVLDMGCLWIPRTQFDAGIDGYIELRDEGTGTVSGSHIAVQSKCGPSYFNNENEEAFTFRPDQRDLDYWSRANLPVLVIVSREPDEAFYFWSNDFPRAASDGSKGIRINKATQRFDRNSRAELLRRAAPPGSGFYFSLPREEEKVWTNMLQLVRYPEQVFTATPVFSSREETFAWLNESAREKSSEIVVRGDYLLSAHDLSRPEWKSLVEAGTVESHAGTEWARADDPESSRRFVELLNKLLRGFLYERGMKLWTEGGYFYFRKPYDANDLKISYQRCGRSSALTVVHGDIREFEGRKFHSYRHMAVAVRWQRVATNWYAVLTPTWHYTVDGEKQEPRHEEWLSGLRKLEKNNTVTSQVLFFADYLGEQTGLFAQRHKWLEFGELRSEILPFKVPDAEWLPPKDEVVSDPNSEPDDASVDYDFFGSDWEDD